MGKPVAVLASTFAVAASTSNPFGRFDLHALFSTSCLASQQMAYAVEGFALKVPGNAVKAFGMSGAEACYRNGLASAL